MGFLSREIGVDQVRSEVMRELERRFPPEFRNRVDEVVLFNPLTRDEVTKIARHYLRSWPRRWSSPGRRLVIGPGALERIVDEGHSLAYGARFLKRVIDDRIKLPISQRWREGQASIVRVRTWTRRGPRRRARLKG